MHPDDRDIYDVVLASILDSREYERLFPGPPLLFDTPYGAGYRTKLRQSDPPLLADSIGGMTHVDKVLSTLSELGLPLSTPIITHTGTRKTIADVLEDSLQRWHPDREVDWTLIAYCGYLHEQNRWSGAHTKDASVDQVLTSVLRHKESACYRTHRLYGMAKACARAQLTPGFFDPALIREAEQELLRVCKVLTANQHPEGYWDIGWDADHVAKVLELKAPRETDVSDPRERLTVTGHMLEWFAIADERLRPPPDVIRRAVEYIEGQLRETPEIYLQTAYLAPATHAVRALCHLSEDFGPPNNRP